MKWTSTTHLREFYDGCYKPQRHTGKSPRTVADYRVTINRYTAFLATQSRPAPQLDNLNTDDLTGFQAWMEGVPLDIPTILVIYILGFGAPALTLHLSYVHHVSPPPPAGV